MAWRTGGDVGAINRTSGLPVYQQIAADLRRRIRASELSPGERMPSERELVEHYGASRVTVRQAVALLRAEGLVMAEHGKGLYVRDHDRIQRLSRNRLRRVERTDGPGGTFSSDLAAAGMTPRVEVDIRTEPADERTASLLAVEPGASVLVRDRRMYADDQPVQLAVSRLPAAVTAGTRIEQRDTGPGGIYARLEEAGHPLGHFVETVAARMPTPEEASGLQLTEGTPVLAVSRTAYTTDGSPVETNDILMAADRYELVYELPAE